MTSEKRTSGKASVHCKFNPVERRWRCNITIGRDRVGPLFVRVPAELDDEADAIDEAARLALARAVERGEVAFDDLEHDGEAFVVEGEGKGTKRRNPFGRKSRAKANAKPSAPVRSEREAKPAALTDRKTKRKAIAKTQAKDAAPVDVENKTKRVANAVRKDGADKPRATERRTSTKRVPNVGKTKPAELASEVEQAAAIEYAEAKDAYHDRGENLRSLHEAMAEAAQGG